MSCDALLVTIGEFPGSSGMLRALPGTPEDGRRVRNWLDTQHGADVNVIAMAWPPDRPATGQSPINKSAVESRITDLLTATSAGMRDRLFVYCSGHGRFNVAQPAMPALYCAQHRRSLPDLFCSFNWIPLLTALPAYREYLFFFDCCNDFQTDPLPALVIPDVELRADRPAVLLVTAAQPGEQAIEQDGGGLFTDVLLEAISGSAGSVGSEEITAANLVDYLKEVVPIRARAIDPARTQRPKVWFDSDLHADLAGFSLCRRNKVSVDVGALLNGHAADSIDVQDFKLQPVTAVTPAAGAAALIADVYPGQYVLRDRHSDWVQAIRIRTTVAADGHVKSLAEAVPLS